MEIKDIYLEGEYYGIYGSGAVIFAKRNTLPELEKGNYYTIKEVLDNGCGACVRNRGIILEEINGIYSKKDFKVNEECHRRMELKSINEKL